MPKRPATALLFAALLMAAAVTGCSTHRKTDPDSGFTLLYAELMLLNEQERFTHVVPDSTYQQHTSALLARYGTTEEEFRKRSNELMKDDRAWRDFLGRVSLVFDSVKTARALPPK
jgi:hypothetical protein